MEEIHEHEHEHEQEKELRVAKKEVEASSRNVGKFYRTLKLSAKNLRFIQEVEAK